MLEKLIDNVAAALLTAHSSRQLIDDVSQERDNTRARMVILEARAEILHLDRDELACVAARLGAALPKLEAVLEQDRRGKLRRRA